ncbi:PadR family transcriptional regulator [Clostridium perfringens]|uniref:Transcriptional regulator, PadR family n=1 Tax=Clostridium perfringens (strain SM101 / Type A) TaxID=289380 RepID=Q0SV74_CLOPS|nr:PadR family transcriptional regulator [Clostridium perfringens]ABG85604.1 transcriptional regulator, PadR family [Clostridium perfringens SM101]EJT5918004.1 helix-turn-helix transcriptional regulator [Clostridium perfringens]EJT5926378.1 helix-turn-helix transcriptional regulator [Clostridium perfringens]EJT5940735.1 helix-turn-helix transcriptional regulator [Clostridium perfringens]EJT6136715.1 helix-turn-helix transcriptional regulator [Clostridium perfringens]
MDREILKGSLEIILLSLLKNKDMYGYEMSKEIKNITENVLILGEGTLYPALKRLKEKNLIQDYFIETNSSKKKRKYYKITEAGLIELNLKLKDFYLISNLIENIKEE